ncbi:hypothetical protein SAMN05216330_10973 [Bradyrhizobium sp. Ghvi]|nr:hypothetical protein SAMN05216330_10973 [Bradyrhizobium sp. Ghvi]
MAVPVQLRDQGFLSREMVLTQRGMSSGLVQVLSKGSAVHATPYTSIVPDAFAARALVEADGVAGPGV